jgi:hypothetical protein
MTAAEREWKRAYQAAYYAKHRDRLRLAARTRQRHRRADPVVYAQDLARKRARGRSPQGLALERARRADPQRWAHRMARHRVRCAERRATDPQFRAERLAANRKHRQRHKAKWLAYSRERALRKQFRGRVPADVLAIARRMWALADKLKIPLRNVR